MSILNILTESEKKQCHGDVDLMLYHLEHYHLEDLTVSEYLELMQVKKLEEIRTGINGFRTEFYERFLQ